MKAPGEERAKPMSLQISKQTKMTFAEAVTAFLDYAASQKVALRTYCFYIDTFRRFTAFIEDAANIDINTIGQETITSFLAARCDDPDSLHYHPSLRALWAWAYRQQVVSGDTMIEFSPLDNNFNHETGGNAVDLHLAASVQSLGADNMRLTEENIRLRDRVAEIEKRTDQLNVYTLNKQLGKLMNVVQPSKTDVYELNKRLDQLHLQLLTLESAYQNPGRIPVLLFIGIIILVVIMAALFLG